MPVGPVTRRGRNTQGMRFASPGNGDSVVAVARNPERAADDADVMAEGDSQASDAVPSELNESGPDDAETTDEIVSLAESADDPNDSDGTGGTE